MERRTDGEQVDDTDALDDVAFEEQLDDTDLLAGAEVFADLRAQLAEQLGDLPTMADVMGQVEEREDFGKYSAGQARDDHGRFASGGTMGGPVGHEVARRTLAEGGSSVHLRTKWTPSTGFMVSTVGHEEVFDKAHISGRTVKDYIHRHREVLDREDAFLGAWHDTSSGKVYLDVSIRVAHREAAMALGRENKQLAIYDAGSDTVIDIDKAKADMTHVVLSKDPADADEVAEFLRSM